MLPQKCLQKCTFAYKIFYFKIYTLTLNNVEINTVYNQFIYVQCFLQQNYSYSYFKSNFLLHMDGILRNKFFIVVFFPFFSQITELLLS